MGKVRSAHHLANSLLHGRGSQVTAMSIDDPSLVMNSMYVSDNDVFRGSPKMRCTSITSSGDMGTSVGLWDCTDGRFKWVFYCDEVVHILEGAVTVHVKGNQMRLTPGSVAYFPIGTDSEWDVHGYVKKVFVHRHPSPFLTRAIGAM